MAAATTAFRFITPTDVDRFVTIKDTLQVDARSIVLTVQEDTYEEITGRRFDYSIYSELPKSDFFDPDMDWRFKLVQKIDPSSGLALGPTVEDKESGVATPQNPTKVIKTISTKSTLGSSETTRFIHYDQCTNFFKYSFKVGDAVDVEMPTETSTDAGGVVTATATSTNKAQLYAIYIDPANGQPKPYWSTTSNTDATTPETKKFYYSKSSDLTAVLGRLRGANTPVTTEILLDSGTTAENVTVVAPPDPEFIEHMPSAGIKGGNLVYKVNGTGDLVIRTVGNTATVGTGANATQPNLITYTASNFEEASSAGNSRALILYWVVSPINAERHMGEKYYVAYSEVALARNGLMPIRDGATVTALKARDKFGLNADVTATTVYVLTAPALADVRRLSLPPSTFTVAHETGGTTTNVVVPFAYEAANATTFKTTGTTPVFEYKKSIVGGRVMQMVSKYIFDNYTNKEMGFFPFLIGEAKSLTETIVDVLDTTLRTNRDVRTEILQQMVVKYGRKEFEESAVFDESTSQSVGRLSAVINNMSQDIFISFTVTVKTTVSNRTKDDVEVISILDIPVTFRLT
jgi:hypothetical protein